MHLSLPALTHLNRAHDRGCMRIVLTSFVDRDSDDQNPNYQPDHDDRCNLVVGQHMKTGYFIVRELMKMLWIAEKFGGGIWYDDVEGGEFFKEHFVLMSPHNGRVKDP
jgi:hypothetical protein